MMLPARATKQRRAGGLMLLRGFLESGRSLHLLNLYMLRDEDAATFIEIYLKFLQERREARERLATGTSG